jgi:hypothetical protein
MFTFANKVARAVTMAAVTVVLLPVAIPVAMAMSASTGGSDPNRRREILEGLEEQIERASLAVKRYELDLHKAMLGVMADDTRTQDEWNVEVVRCNKMLIDAMEEEAEYRERLADVKALIAKSAKP